MCSLASEESCQEHGFFFPRNISDPGEFFQKQQCSIGISLTLTSAAGSSCYPDCLLQNSDQVFLLSSLLEFLIGRLEYLAVSEGVEMDRLRFQSDFFAF
jgi:hypothetical protein